MTKSTWSNKLLEAAGLASPLVVGWSGTLARNMSRWFLKSGKSLVFIPQGLWQHAKEPGSMNSQGPFPGMLDTGWSIPYNGVGDGKSASSVTPLPFH